MLALMVWFFYFILFLYIFFLLLAATTCPWGDVSIFCSWKWRRKSGFYLYGM